MNEIKYIERRSQTIKVEKVPSLGMLKWLYNSATGKLALNVLFKRKIISLLGGWYMNKKHSAKRIPKFVNDHNINLQECEESNTTNFKTFNNFFYRKLKSDARKIEDGIVSPADGKILVFPKIKDISSFFVKGTEFSLQSFFCNKLLVNKYEDGAMAIIRLAPADYHRFHFPASGIASESIKIKGHYFSVSPFALRGSLRILCENKREYCTLSSFDCGDVLIVDVGATMVGGITQTYRTNSEVKKGDEKGYFSFGGSTLVLLFEKDKIEFDSDLQVNTKNGFETTVLMGENIASPKKV